MDHATKAVELFMQGYNCAQSVFCAFCDLTKLDFETSLKLSSSMGGGVGRLREICGALSGMLLVAGCLYGYTDISTNDAKSEHYALVQQLAKSFEEKAGATICQETNLAAVVATEIKGDRIVPAAELADIFRKYTKAEVTAVTEIKDAFKEAMKLKEDGMLFCVGSLYLVGELKGILGEYK